MTLVDSLRTEAHDLGFDAVGICRAEETRYWEAFLEWLERGYAGAMQYIPRRREAYRHPAGVLQGCHTVVMLALGYSSGTDVPPAPGRGRVARYARGRRDYHDVVREKLRRLTDWMRRREPEARVRGVVDTAPLFEREFAERAGLGWIGKHTLLLDRRRGSWFFLAALLTDLILPVDEQPSLQHCGTCTACLESCPTDAFPAPYQLDARKCISYLTIEHRGPIPLQLRDGIGDWVFGCDVCQEVCPWNRKAPAGTEPDFLPQPELSPLDLRSLFELDDASFKRRFAHTPLSRPGRAGLLRNAAIVLGNQRAVECEPQLCRALEDDDPCVRGAVAWALGKLGTARGRQALLARRSVESDPDVLEEITAALQEGKWEG